MTSENARQWGRAIIVVTLITWVSVDGPPEARGSFPGAIGRVAFDVYQDNMFRLFSVEGDGTDPVEIASASDASWSPDGERLAVGGGAISVMRADGSGRRLVWSDPNGNVILGDPSWSPDGTRIAFTSSNGSSGIASVRIDGRDVRGFPTEGLRSARQPAWSPDGRRVAFVGTTVDSDTGLFDAELYVMGENGSGRVKMTELTDGIPEHPSWSPDGSRVAFGTINTSARDIYVVDVASMTLTNLTSDFDGSAGYPVWSPDGADIAHVRDVTQLTVMHSDGSDPVTIVSAGGEVRRPDWQALCTIRGTSGADTLVGTAGNDRICAGPGNDEVSSGAGADVVFGGGGADVIRTAGGPDIVNADAGADVVVGGPGGDLLTGGLGTAKDRLRGGDGSDRLDTRDGSGGDLLDGGAGVDRCRGDRTDLRRGCP